MNEKEIYKELIRINKEKSPDSIEYIGSHLENPSIKIKSKVLWMLGEFGLLYPEKISPYVNDIGILLNHEDEKIRERSLNALGRIGRGDYKLISPYFEDIMEMYKDKSAKVRLSFIWACENIGTNSPQLFKNRMEIFSLLLVDSDDKVRIEAPEMFRVMGKRIPSSIYPYLDKLKFVSENDENKIVKIHAKGAIKTTLKNKD